MRFGNRCSSPFVTSFGMRMLNSACAALTRLLNDCMRSRLGPTLPDSADPGPAARRILLHRCRWSRRRALCAIVAPAAMVAAAPPTCDKKRADSNLSLRRVSWRRPSTRKVLRHMRLGRLRCPTVRFLRAALQLANVGLDVVEEPTLASEVRHCPWGQIWCYWLSPYRACASSCEMRQRRLPADSMG